MSENQKEVVIVVRVTLKMESLMGNRRDDEEATPNDYECETNSSSLWFLCNGK